MESESSKYEDCLSKFNNGSSNYQDAQSKVRFQSRTNSSNKFQSCLSVYEDAQSKISIPNNQKPNINNNINELYKNSNWVENNNDRFNAALTFQPKNSEFYIDNSKYSDIVAITTQVNNDYCEKQNENQFDKEVKNSNEMSSKTGGLEKEEIKGGCCNNPNCVIF